MVSKTSFGSNETIWDKLVQLGFFPAKPLCEHCQQPLNFELNRKRLHFSVRCTRKACKKYTNLMRGYQMDGVNDVRNFLAAAESWVSDGKVETLLAQTGMTPKTWAHYRQRLQNTVDLTLEKMEVSGELKMGGKGKVVEVDEAKLFSAKYHKGLPPAADKLWVVGIIERDRDDQGLRRSAFMLTEDRSAAVLLPFIEKWVKEETTVLTDGWAAYTGRLKNIYFHEKINHKELFARKAVVNGAELNVNTNHIEREWVQVRKVLRHRSMSAYDSQLNKEIFRILFLAGKKPDEQAYILLKKMAMLN